MFLNISSMVALDWSGTNPEKSAIGRLFMIYVTYLVRMMIRHSPLTQDRALDLKAREPTKLPYLKTFTLEWLHI